MRVKISSQKRVYYEGRDRVEGEIIEMTDKQARINIKLGRVVNAEGERPLRVADPQPVRRGPGRPRKNPLPDDAGTYSRRDMRAED